MTLLGTSVVKATFNCLCPWLGGQEGSPDDQIILILAVSKSQETKAEQGVEIKLWAHGRDDSPQPVMPDRLVSSAILKSSGARQVIGQNPSFTENPCVSGTRKWIVCEGALADKSVGEVKSDLESAYQGSGRRIMEYISDLRSENSLDIMIEDGRLYCRGRLA